MPAPEGAPARYTLTERLDDTRWFATDNLGRPSLVFELAKTGDSRPRRLRYLLYSPPSPMRLVADGVERVMSAAVLVCRAEDPLLRRQFAPLASAMCSFDEDPPSELALERRLDAFIELLAALTQPPKHTAQGLWAELAIVAWASDVVVATDAWHQQPRALHDFMHAADRLEVKSTVDVPREHALKLAQLDESQGLDVVVASFVLTEHDEGATIGDLLTAALLRLRAHPERQRKVRSMVHKSLGCDLENGTSVRFDAGRARAQLRFYAAGAVPAVATPLRHEVSEVHFVSDLTDAVSLLPSALAARSAWWKAMLPPSE